MQQEAGLCGAGALFEVEGASALGLWDCSDLVVDGYLDAALQGFDAALEGQSLDDELALLPSLNPSGSSLAVVLGSCLADFAPQAVAPLLQPTAAAPPAPASQCSSGGSEGTPIAAPASPASTTAGAPLQQAPILLARHTVVSRGPNLKRARSPHTCSGTSNSAVDQRKPMAAQLPPGPSPPLPQGSSASQGASLPTLCRTVTTTLPAVAPPPQQAASPESAPQQQQQLPGFGPAIAAIASTFEAAFAAHHSNQQQQQPQTSGAASRPTPAAPTAVGGRRARAAPAAAAPPPPPFQSEDFDDDMEDEEDMDNSSDFEGSNLTDDDDQPATKKANKGGKVAGAKNAGGSKGSGKRKAPDVDWRSIEDPAERRRQRRLAKNRVTAARSRERKKSQWAVLETRLAEMETEGRALREMLEAVTGENAALRAQLAAALGGAAAHHHHHHHSRNNTHNNTHSNSAAAGVQSAGGAASGTAGAAAAAAAAAGGSTGGKGGHGEPAALVLLAIMLLFVTALPSAANSSSSSSSAPSSSSEAAAALLRQQQLMLLLGNAMPALLLLLAGLLSTSSGSRSSSSARGSASTKQQQQQQEAMSPEQLKQHLAQQRGGSGNTRRRQQQHQHADGDGSSYARTNNNKVAPTMGSGTMAAPAAALPLPPGQWGADALLQPSSGKQWLPEALALWATVAGLVTRGRKASAAQPAAARSTGEAGGAVGRIKAHLMDWRRAAPMGLTCGL